MKQIFLIPNEMIVVFGLPEWGWDLELLGSLMGREGFLGMQYLVEFLVALRFEHDMHMIGHDAPSEERVALAIEVSQGVLHQVRDFRTLHPTGTHARIKMLL